MKLVERQYFLKLPAGTVYCKFPLTDNGNAKGMTFGLSAPCIKGDTIGEDDFCTCTLGEDLEPKFNSGTEGLFDTFFDMQKNLAKEVSFELSGGRDGFFDDENVGFMIFSKEEVQEMISELQDCLKKAY